MFNVKKKITYTSALAFALSLLVNPAVAKPLEGFQFEAPLTEGKASLRRAELPADVLFKLEQRDFKDLVVLNAADQIVPSSVQPIYKMQEGRVSESRSLSFFRNDDQQQLGTLLTLSQGATKPDLTQLTQPGKHYLIVHDPNFSQTSLPLNKLRLEWSNLEQWLPKSVLLEASEDLINWRPVAVTALPYLLKEQDKVLENHELILQEPVHAPFIRLSGDADLALLSNALSEVYGDFGKDSPTQDLHWGKLALQVSPEQPNRFNVSLPQGLTISQWRMADLPLGSMYSGAWESLAKHDARFGDREFPIYQGEFHQYRLKTEAGELQSRPINVDNVWASEWRLNFAQGSALPTANTAVEVGWEAVEIRYIAQGQGPFRLAFGSPMPNATRNPSLDEPLLKQVNPETVSIGQALRVADPPIASDRSHLWTLALWALLGFAVLLLLWMARNLWTDMQKQNPV